MYKVFLVDDEPIVLEGIRTKLEWEKNGFIFAGEATDGEIALSMIHEIKPDIVITDIKMPFMDGLQLSAEIKKLIPWIKIIILSGHDEFEYAKKAISIGVEDYLLKPFTFEEVLQSLLKVSAHIDVEKKQLSDISKMKEELKSTEQIIKKDFLNNLLHGSENLSDIVNKSQELKIDLISRYYKVLVSEIVSKSDNTVNQQEAISLLNSYSSTWEQTISYFHHSNRLICIVKNGLEEELEDNVYQIAKSIEYIGTQNPDCKITTAIGKTVDHLSELPASYEDAKKILDASNYKNENRILSAEDLSQNNNGILELKDSDPLVNRLKYASKQDISSIIEETMTLIHNNKDQFQVISSYLMVDIIFDISKLVESLGGSLKDIKPEFLQKSFVDYAVQDENNFNQKLVELLDFAIEYRDSKISGKYGDVILKAKKYIDEHFTDQNITLTTVAEEVCLSPNHFSTIFSQECKTTFIEYLTDVRIENAKKLLLTTEMKGYDIAYECGFSDPHYFSYIFKKNTGLSPREYKSNITD